MPFFETNVAGSTVIMPPCQSALANTMKSLFSFSDDDDDDVLLSVLEEDVVDFNNNDKNDEGGGR